MSIQTLEFTQNRHIRLGDRTDSEITEILSGEDLLEQSYVEVSLDDWEIPTITLAEEELNLFHKIVNGLVKGEMNYGTAVLLTVMYACAVEDRVKKH